MTTLWRSIKHSLTWRIVLMTAFIQLLMLLAIFTYQRHVLAEFANSLGFSERDAGDVFTLLNSELIPLSTIELTDDSEVLVLNDGESLLPEEDSIKLNRIWRHLVANNPGFWYHIDSNEVITSGKNKAPANALKLLSKEVSISSETNNCTEQSEFAFVDDKNVYNIFIKCPDGAYFKAQFGGLEPDYQPPTKDHIWYFSGSDNNLSKVFIGLLLTLLIMIPGIVYLLLKPMRSALAAVEKMSPSGSSKQIPTEEIPTELLGFTNALNSAFKRLDEGYRRERRFRNAMAHEIRTPLTVLRARLDDQVPTEELRTLLKTDIRNVQNLVDRLLELAKVAPLARDFESVDLVKATRSACAECGATAISAGIEIDFEFSGDSAILVQANPTAVNLAITNVINNAIHHSETSDAIEVRVLKNGTVKVRDYGRGIAEELKQSLFEPFAREQSSKEQGAHGLGLAIVAEVMRYSQGHVVVDSETSDSTQPGTTFCLNFKLAHLHS